MIHIPEDGYFQPRVKPKHRCPMTPELTFVRKQLIPKLLKHPYSLPFKYPVDAIAEGIYPDYFMVISHPMDLYTIKSRLDQGWYWSLNHCLADINLVWRNARLYNPPDHILHQWAVAMKTFTNNMLKKLRTQTETSDKTVHRLRLCEDLLEKVVREEQDVSAPFKIINSPCSAPGHAPGIDLDTIENKLKGGQYGDAEAFANDFRRMITETYRHCSEADPLIEQAQQLHHKFEYEYAHSLLKSEEEEMKLNQIYREEHVTSVLEDMMKKATEIETQLNTLIQEEDLRQEEERRKEAKDLVLRISVLDSARLTEVLRILEEDGQDIELEEEDTLSIDFENMSDRTLKHLRQFVDSVG